jgi:hypothetical protein
VFGPIAEAVTEELGIELEDVNIDETPTPGIMSVPTIRLIREDGTIVGESVGAMSEASLREWVSSKL